MLKSNNIIFLILFLIVSCNGYPPLDLEDFFEETKDGFNIRDHKNDNINLRISKTRSIIPKLYKIKLKPIFDENEIKENRFTIPASIAITFDVNEDTNIIDLHSERMIFNNQATKIVSKGVEGNKEISIKSQLTKNEEGRHVIETSTLLVKGETFEIYTEYTGSVIRDQLNGMYLSNYTNPTSNQTEYLVVTHFEPESARKLFPCIDEPDLKAVFEITVGRRDGYTSVSNMDIKETTTDSDGWYWDNYNPTPLMSTYLVAVLVSKFTKEVADSKLFGGKPVQIWGAKHYMEKGGGVFAAETAAKILEYYQNYYKANYPLPKMDSVAIPHFEAGAMENYGLNTYREKYLLYFPGESTESERYGICSVVGHELAHQWFGDLVTCQSWSHLWLNEGFAAFVETIGAEVACPEYLPWDSFLPSTFQTAMTYDQSSNSHPLVNESNSQAQFTRITYEKGASLLRMLRSILGPDTFLTALQNYLQKMSFSNAIQDDLLSSFEEQARKDNLILPSTIPDIMENWTLKKGYPLVRVEILDSKHVSISQEPFVKAKHLRDSRSIIDERSSDLWWIPFKITTKASPIVEYGVDLWMPGYIQKLETEMDASDWLIVNSGANGYYRVIYDPVITSKLKEQLNEDHTIISPNSRNQLIDDAFNLAFTNYIDIKDALEYTRYLDKETHYGVWTTALTNFKRSINLLSTTPAFGSLQAYLQPKLNSALNAIGYDQPLEEKGQKVLLRSLLMDFACSLNDEQCIKYTQKLMQNWINTPSKNLIATDIQKIVYCTSLKMDNTSTSWDFLYNKYLTEEGVHKGRILTALACSKNTTKTKTILKTILEDSNTVGLNEENIKYFIDQLAKQSEGREVLLDFMYEKPTRVFGMYRTEKKKLKILRKLTSYVNTGKDSEKMRGIIGMSKGYLEHNSIRTIFELIEDNLSWMSKYYEPMKSWFDDEVSGAPRTKGKVTRH